MRGWKPVERTVTTRVSLEEAVRRALEEGFQVRQRHTALVLLHRPGTQLALRGEKFPLELAVAESDEGLFLQLRYDTFALADSGDLDRLADDLAGTLARTD